MGVWEEYSQGEGRLQKQVGLHFPLESETRHRTQFCFASLAKGEAVQPPIWG